MNGPLFWECPNCEKLNATRCPKEPPGVLCSWCLKRYWLGKTAKDNIEHIPAHDLNPSQEEIEWFLETGNFNEGEVKDETL